MTRAPPHILRRKPPMTPMRSWPRERRCSVASTPPCQLAAPTDTTPGGGSSTGSIITNGTRCCSSQAYWDEVSSARWNSTPAEPRVVSLSSQSRSGRPPPVRGRLGRDDHLQARVVRRTLHPVQHRARPGTLQRVHHEVDQPRRLCRLEAGSADVAESVERFGHPAAGLRCHVLPAVDHLRRRRHRHPRRTGDDRQRRPGHASRTHHESPPPRPARGPVESFEQHCSHDRHRDRVATAFYTKPASIRREGERIDGSPRDSSRAETLEIPNVRRVVPTVRPGTVRRSGRRLPVPR